MFAQPELKVAQMIGCYLNFNLNDGGSFLEAFRDYSTGINSTAFILSWLWSFIGVATHSTFSSVCLILMLYKKEGGIFNKDQRNEKKILKRLESDKLPTFFHIKYTRPMSVHIAQRSNIIWTFSYKVSQSNFTTR